MGQIIRLERHEGAGGVLRGVDERPLRFWFDEQERVVEKESNSGMGPRAPSSRFARMTASSTSCGMTPRLLMGRGVLLRLGIQGRAELSPAFWGDRISTFCHLPLGEIEMAAVMRRPLSHSDFYSHMLYGLFVF